jgi:hypothetical protein
VMFRDAYCSKSHIQLAGVNEDRAVSSVSVAFMKADMPVCLISGFLDVSFNCCIWRRTECWNTV